MVKVEYDGEYPNMCTGTLTIFEDGVQIYSKSSCFENTGKAGFNNNWESQIIKGKLIWLDADKFSKEISDAVEEKLDEYSVCCGGCI